MNLHGVGIGVTALALRYPITSRRGYKPRLPSSYLKENPR